MKGGEKKIKTNHQKNKKDSFPHRIHQQLFPSNESARLPFSNLPLTDRLPPFPFSQRKWQKWYKSLAYIQQQTLTDWLTVNAQHGRIERNFDWSKLTIYYLWTEINSVFGNGERATHKGFTVSLHYDISLLSCKVLAVGYCFFGHKHFLKSHCDISLSVQLGFCTD